MKKLASMVMAFIAVCLATYVVYRAVMAIIAIFK